jgi:hypothetical protein
LYNILFIIFKLDLYLLMVHFVNNYQINILIGYKCTHTPTSYLFICYILHIFTVLFSWSKEQWQTCYFIWDLIIIIQTSELMTINFTMSILAWFAMVLFIDAIVLHNQVPLIESVYMKRVHLPCTNITFSRGHSHINILY